MAVNHTIGQIERGAAWSQVSRRINVGSGWTLAAKANTNRRWLLAQNIADEYIEILFADSTPTSGQEGRYLAKAGDTYAGIGEYSECLGNLDRRALYARCTSGSKALVIVEAPADVVDTAEAPAGYSSSSSSSSNSSSSSSTTSSSSLGLSSSSSSSSTSTSTSTSSQGLSSSSSSSTSTSTSQGLSSSSSSWSSASSSSSSVSGP